jgi:guanylate kinase
MIAQDEFLEYAEVFGNYYGTARRSLDEATAAGRDLLLDIDVQGAQQVRERFPRRSASLSCRPIQRSCAPGCATAAAPRAMSMRQICSADWTRPSKEIENYSQYRYILVNDILERAVAQLEAIVQVERMKQERQTAGQAHQKGTRDCGKLPRSQFPGTTATQYLSRSAY